MKIFKLSIFLVMAVLVMAGAVSAAPVRIASITDHIDGPVRIAVDAQGNLYVAQSAKNTVAIYTSEGRFQRSFSVSYPLGIAVDASGTIYVGSGASGKRDGNRNAVYVFTPALVQSGVLGSGAGEFAYPNDIAVGADGKVYVADTLNHVVKVFDPATGAGFSFGGYGSTSGLFKRPAGVAVNDAAGELFVTDSPVVTTSSGPADGARIQVFNKNGQFLRSFGRFGDGTGQMSSPAGIAVDSAGLLYVTDSKQSVVHILNPSDGSLAGSGRFDDSSKPLYNPIGVAAGKNGLVYVVSFRGEGNKGRIDVYALDGYVTMTVDPLSLAFIGTQYAGNPDPRTIVIANTGSGTLNWSATADQDWINLGKQDPVGPGSAGGLAVGVNISAFGVGTYTGTITIDSGFGRKQAVGVTLSVVQPPILKISNGWLTFTARKGTSPASQGITLGIDNLNGPVTWGIASDSPSWLTVSPASGTISSTASSATASVSINTTGLKVGSYSGLLTVTAPGAIGTGGKVTVNLTVSPSTKLSVATNLDQAAFAVSGAAAFSGGGRNWSMEDVPTGTYTIAYTAVPGYAKPEPQTLTIADSGEIVFSGAYVLDDVPPTLALSALADGAYTNNATLNVAGTVADNGAVQGVTINDTAVTVNADGTFSQAVPLVAGVNFINVIASDTAGNATRDARTITLDQTSPVITISRPSDNSVTNEADLTLSGTVDKTATVIVQVSGEHPAPAPMTGSAFSLPVALPFGQNTIQVTATDRAGNVGMVKRTVTFDNANPTIAVTYPAEDITTNQTSITLEGTVADLTGTTVTVTYDGTESAPPVENGIFQQRLTFTEDKTYAVLVTATDAAGNTTTIQRNIIYATTPAALTYTGKTLFAQGRPAVLTATLKAGDASAPPPSGQTISFILGGGPNSQSCVGATDAGGNASCVISSVAAPLGPATITATYTGDGGSRSSVDARTATIFAYPAAGSFVIGDRKAAVGNAVTFWGAKRAWAKANALSGGEAPAVFRGFAGSTSVSPPACGGTWSANTGSGPTPPGGIPSYMAVIATGSMTKSGGKISGDSKAIVIVETKPGYGPDPRYPGVGTVVGVLCSE